MSPTEKEIQNSILEYLNTLFGVMAWTNQSVGIYDAKRGVYRRQGRFHNKGVSDIVGIYRSKPLFIEVKSAKGRLSPHQRDFLNDVKRLGAIAFVARSVDDVAREFKAYETLIKQQGVSKELMS